MPDISYFLSIFSNRWIYKLRTENIAKSVFLLLVVVFNGSVFANESSWAPFGGATVTEEVLEVPAGSQSWAGFAYTNNALYPISLTDGGQITFTAAVNGSADVRFRFERLPYPDVEPAFNTSAKTVSGTSEVTYTIEVPEQGENIYRNLILASNHQKCSSNTLWRCSESL